MSAPLKPSTEMGVEGQLFIKIVACIKQVPDTTEVKIDSTTGTLIREGIPTVINPFDLHAIEEGLRIIERIGGRVIAISMGPPQAKEAVKDALAMGCHEGILLTDRAFVGADTLATSYTLACGIRKTGIFDLVICGMKTIDGDTGQVGPGLAQELGIPHIAYVSRICEITHDHIVVEKLVENGLEVIYCPLPCLITVVKGINEPRLPSLKLKLKARKAEIKKWGVKELKGEKHRYGLEGSPTRVIKIFTPKTLSKARIIGGTPRAQAEKLCLKLKEMKII
ncbi:electron transfer flavoprotein subunit beta/FixA family protein [[Eubacterium] cellulosolvens]